MFQRKATVDSKNKKKRCANFTNEETMLLLDCIEPYKDIINSKETGAVLWNDKSKAWATIAENFQSRSPSVRTLGQLKGKYENMKRLSRENNPKRGQKLYGTEESELVQSARFVEIVLPTLKTTRMETSIETPVETLLETPLDNPETSGDEDDGTSYTSENVERPKSAELKLKQGVKRKRLDSKNGESIHSLVNLRQQAALALIKNTESREAREAELHAYDLKIKEANLENIRLQNELLKRKLDQGKI